MARGVSAKLLFSGMARDVDSEPSMARHALTVGLTLVLAITVPIAPGQDLKAAPTESVTLQYQEGKTLPGEFRNAGPGSAAVLFFHMCNPGTAHGWTPLAERLRARGVSSLVINYAPPRDNWTAEGTAAVAYLRSRLGQAAPLAVAGASCGVQMALHTARTLPDSFRAVAVLTGPYDRAALEFVRSTPAIAVYSGASRDDGPAPGWARELREASANPASTLSLLDKLGHGTDLLEIEQSLVGQMTGWVAERLKGMAGSLEGPVAAQSPSLNPGRTDHMMFDARLGAMVIIEGPASATTLRLWKLDGLAWKLIDDAGPPVRELGAATFDAERKQIVLQGGMAGGGEPIADFWRFDGRSWSAVSVTSPGARDHHAMTYDAARKCSVLYGGRVTTDRLGTDTWEWDGAMWRRFDGPGPGGRAHTPLAYDTVRGGVLLFGGMDQQNRAKNDLWSWDGREWNLLSDGGPPPRSHHRMAFDDRTGTLVVFGGQRGTSAFDDTWVWDGARWTEMKGPGPERRGGHMMAYDPIRQRVLLFGGSYFDGRVSHRHTDLWSWDGARWELLAR